MEWISIKSKPIVKGNCIQVLVWYRYGSPEIIYYGDFGYGFDVFYKDGLEIDKHNVLFWSYITQPEDMKHTDQITNYVSELESVKAELIEAMVIIKDRLENDKAIIDTIWISDNEMETETLVDRIDYFLDKYKENK